MKDSDADPKWTKVRDGLRKRYGYDCIWRFRGEHMFLSNMFMSEGLAVQFEGMQFPSSEHAFVAAKTLDVVVRQEIADTPDPKDAKRYGRQLELREDWEDVKEDVMLEILRSKFSRSQNHGMAKQLLDTGRRPLIEGNLWRDTYWGMATVDGEVQGENLLGQLLMKVRQELAEGRQPPPRIASAAASQRQSPQDAGHASTADVAVIEDVIASGLSLPKHFSDWLRHAISEDAPAEDVDSLVASVEVILAGAEEDEEAVSSAVDVLCGAGATNVAEALPSKWASFV